MPDNKPHNLAYISRDRGYRFADRDPDMIWICDLIDKSGKSISEIQELVLDITDNKMWISYATIANWLSGKTRRPQNATITAVALALGYKKEWTKLR